MSAEKLNKESIGEEQQPTRPPEEPPPPPEQPPEFIREEFLPPLLPKRPVSVDKTPPPLPEVSPDKKPESVADAQQKSEPEINVPEIEMVRNVGHHKTPEEIERDKKIREENDSPEKFEARKKKEKERALGELSEADVMEKSHDELENIFRKATGESLTEKRERMVDDNLRLRNPGAKVLRGKEAVEKYRQELVGVEQENILQENHEGALDTFWARNQNVKEEDREKYLAKIKNKLGLEGGDGDIAFDRLVNDGYLVEKAKISWWSGKLKISDITGKETSIFRNKKDLADRMVQKAEDDSLRGAETRADNKIIEGRHRLLAERAICTKEIIKQTIMGSAEKERKPEKARLGYVSLGGLIDRVHAKGGHTRNILELELRKRIKEGQYLLRDGGFTIEQWNQVMANKFEAQKLLQEWLGNHKTEEHAEERGAAPEEKEQAEDGVKKTTRKKRVKRPEKRPAEKKKRKKHAK